MAIDMVVGAVNNLQFSQAAPVKAAESGGLFEQFYNAALEVVNEVNTAQINADQIQRDFAAGKTDNVLSVVMAQEKASSMLNFTVQVTNKVIESYREIMRIQI